MDESEAIVLLPDHVIIIPNGLQRPNPCLLSQLHYPHTSPLIGVMRSDVPEAVVVPLMVVPADKGPDGYFQFAGHVIGSQPHFFSPEAPKHSLGLRKPA